jgi:glycosyltransferase involved in cell wall biosynthesis
MTFEPQSSAAYQVLLGKPVGVVPLPRLPTMALRNRAGRRPITVAVIGHQRPDKGYHLVPEVARQLLQARPDIRVLVHNGDPQGMPEAQQAMRALAAANRRVVIDERLAGQGVWAELLDASDLILCPYDPGRFAFSYSAVAAEAVANGIPMVVPAGSSLARLVAEFGGAGTTFDRAEPAYLVDATLQALQQFDRLAAIAFAGAEKWTKVHGPRKFVDAILAL